MSKKNLPDRDSGETSKKRFRIKIESGYTFLYLWTGSYPMAVILNFYLLGICRIVYYVLAVKLLPFDIVQVISLFADSVVI